MRYEVLKQAADPSGLPCFAIVRNESYFLPHFLDHYRRLGISHFVFYDDKSTDGTRELLLSQEDCTVLTSHRSFREPMGDGRPFHYYARTLIPEQFGAGGWCLSVDADEFLLLPERFSSIQEVIADLEERKHACVLAPMVEFYPERLSLRHYPRNLGPFEGCDWWFDPDPAFRRKPVHGEIEAVPKGIRVRLLKMLMARAPARVERAFEGKVEYAKLWKVPLVKTGRRIERLDTHSVNMAPPADVQLALAHFKFYPDLDARIREALELKTHYKQGVEYRFLEAALELLSDEPLVNDRSVRFKSAKSLEEAGLLYAKPSKPPPEGGTPLPTTMNPDVEPKVSMERLFGTPIVVTSLPDPTLISALEQAVLARRAGDPGIQKSNAGGWHSDLGLLQWGGEPARRLISHVFDLATAQTVLKHDDPAVSYQWSATAWANVNQSGARNVSHAHPGCFWSAVYYLRVDPGTGGELLLRDPRVPTMEMSAPSLWYARSGVQREAVIKPVPGLLILFPSWLVHSVREWHGEGCRMSIAINLQAKFDKAAAK